MRSWCYEKHGPMRREHMELLSVCPTACFIPSPFYKDSEMTNLLQDFFFLLLAKLIKHVSISTKQAEGKAKAPRIGCFPRAASEVSVFSHCSLYPQPLAGVQPTCQAELHWAEVIPYFGTLYSHLQGLKFCLCEDHTEGQAN